MVVILASYGLTMIITRGYIFKSLREYLTTKSNKLGIMISCPQCVGVYCGFLLSLLSGIGIWNSFLISLTVSGIAYTINKIWIH
jgi:formate-dependent nitrite reductase membrane component NrfD